FSMPPCSPFERSFKPGLCPARPGPVNGRGRTPARGPGSVGRRSSGRAKGEELLPSYSQDTAHPWACGKTLAAEMSGLGVHYDLGEGHPLLGRRMPDLDLVTASGPLRVFTLLHDAWPVLLNLDELGGFDSTPWADRVQLIDAKYV